MGAKPQMVAKIERVWTTKNVLVDLKVKYKKKNRKSGKLEDKERHWMVGTSVVELGNGITDLYEGPNGDVFVETADKQARKIGRSVIAETQLKLVIAE